MSATTAAAAVLSYVSGRKRKVNEINGKSANLNNCLKVRPACGWWWWAGGWDVLASPVLHGEPLPPSARNAAPLQNYVYASWPKNEAGEIDWTEISNKELIVVFDADMCAKQEFYLRVSTWGGLVLGLQNRVYSSVFTAVLHTAEACVSCAMHPAQRLNAFHSPLSGLLQILEVMLDEELALCLSPQSFHNISPGAWGFDLWLCRSENPFCGSGRHWVGRDVCQDCLQ
jgi:hypothetical protein